MCNQEIILNAAIALMQEGKLGTTGGTIEMVDKTTGEIITMAEPEELHTYKEWQKSGYQVQRGQKAIAMLSIWRMKKDKENKDSAAVPEGMMEVSLAPKNFYMVTAAFFSRAQVEVAVAK